MPAGILGGTLLGTLFGLSVRTRGVYFILVTLAMGYIIWGVGYRWTALTGGDSGITNVPAPALGDLKVTNASQFYYLVLAVVVLVLIVYQRLVSSAFGLALRGLMPVTLLTASGNTATPARMHLPSNNSHDCLCARPRGHSAPHGHGQSAADTPRRPSCVPSSRSAL